MTPKSGKAKSRRLQNWVRDLIKRLFNTDAIRVPIMGESGVDVQFLDKKLQAALPYRIECKNVEQGFTAIYNAYKQCENHKGKGEPLIVIKQNYRKPLVVLDATYFFVLQKEYDKCLKKRRLSEE